MAAGDLYNIRGGLFPQRHSLKLIGGDADDGVQIDALAAAGVLANHTSGTISAWIMIPDLTGTYAIAGAGDAGAVEYFDFKVVAGKLNFYAINGADVGLDITTTNVVLIPYKWHHVTFVQDAVVPKIYVDGLQITEITETDITDAGDMWFDVLDQIDGMHIGCSDSVAGGALLTNEFKGLMGTTTIWSGTTTTGALTAAQVLLDFEGKDTGVTPYGQYTFTDSTLYTNAANPGVYDGTKVGDFTRVNNGCEFVARLQYELTPIVVADIFSFAVSDNTGHAVVVKAA